jgi:predicted site-specific integrase-resolvase
MRSHLGAESDDLLLNMSEIIDAWEVSAWTVRRLVKEGKLRRVRRPQLQPYYPLSAVEAILGPPRTAPTPRYPRGDEREADEQLAA